MSRSLVIIVLALMLGACDETPKEETHIYHVYLHNQKGQTLYSGQVTGLSSCRYIANNRIRGDKNPGWDYYCCLEKGGNQCYEKHR